MEVKRVDLGEIHDIWELDSVIFSPQWHCAEGVLHELVEKNPEAMRALFVNNQVKGYYILVPLKKGDYEHALSGELSMEELVHCMLPEFQKDNYLYILSVMVDIRDQNASLYVYSLVRDIRRTLVHTVRAGHYIHQMGAIVVTPEGEKMAQRVGMKLCDDLTPRFNCMARAYRGDVELMNIRGKTLNEFALTKSKC